jgi:hypothetical protein
VNPRRIAAGRVVIGLIAHPLSFSLGSREYSRACEASLATYSSVAKRFTTS